SMKRHRIALIGTGKSVGNHLRAIEANQERIELVAAVDMDADRVRSVCEENHIPRWYTSTADMLSEIQPDIVHIITPPATHVDLAIECMEAGAWVYCEKPLCASLAEFDRLEEAEQGTGRYVSTVFQWRFGSAVKQVRNLIQTEEMGKLLVSVCHTLWYRTHEYYAAPWRGKWET
ncbi:MAG TPA: Gfo/Idh/MocA family oxidoreductase, partial [Aggregatilineales bacterium]|nr:Gfo/Idh/MocA family oxidoreductase [Aggregatilineales bacterium]